MVGFLELHLVRARAPQGEIRARTLAVLADALQELRVRIGRDLLDAPGPGRTRQFMEELAEIRLRGIKAGSTVLTFAQGPTDKLEGLLAEEERLEQRFFEVVEAIGRDERPAWVTDLIADSAARLVDGFKAAAPEVVLREEAGREVTVHTDRIHRETWANSRILTDETMTARGRLERVDLRTHEFRVRDDIGNAVDLRHVEGGVTVGKLVGQWVAATGRAVINAAGRLLALEDAQIHEVEDPAAPYAEHGVVPLVEILASAPGPEPGGVIDLDGDEFAAFLEAARS